MTHALSNVLLDTATLNQMTWNELHEHILKLRGAILNQEESNRSVSPFVTHFGEAYDAGNVIAIPLTIDKLKTLVRDLKDRYGNYVNEAEEHFSEAGRDDAGDEDYYYRQALARIESELYAGTPNVSNIGYQSEKVLNDDFMSDILLDIYESDVNTQDEYTVMVPLTCYTKVNITAGRFNDNSKIASDAKDSIRSRFLPGLELQDWEVDDNVEDSDIEVEKIS